MKLSMKLSSLPFEAINSGNKTIEIRLNDLNRRMIHLDDTIVFINSSDPKQKLTVKVTDLHRFKSFQELYDALPLSALGYTEDEVANASAEDMREYYSEAEELEHGVLGIEFEKIEAIEFD